MSKSFKIPKLIPIGSKLVCADSSGAKMLQVIGFTHYQGTRKRRLTGGIGSVAVVVVKKGKVSLKKKKHYALIIRQKYPIIRLKGPVLGKVYFPDNAAILLDENKKYKKTSVKGVIAREVLSFNKNYQNIAGDFR
jgi:large subunit ribosomal protein L14